MNTKTPRKNVKFIATQYKNKPLSVSFYTTKGEDITFVGTVNVPAKTGAARKARKR